MTKMSKDKLGDLLIVRLSAGLANQMYEFASAYALAKELGKELAVDISSCYASAYGYLLDYFRIPSCKKILYMQNGDLIYAHTDPSGLPNSLKEEAHIWVESGSGYVRYEGLDRLEGMDSSGSIYLCGYFFNRKRYYDRYWEEIRRNFTLKRSFREVDKFKELIDGKVSVGVHIRRGDMLLADFATAMKDDYYRAAVAYCRKRDQGCIFCIFSDDIEYAKQLLGQDSGIYYVHFYGYDDAALLEFICLSLCSHRILSNNSTFGRLADELNTDREGRYFVQATASGWTELKNHLIRIKDEKLLKKQQSRRIIIDQYDIRKYAAGYKADRIPNLKDYAKRVERLLDTEITEENADFILNEIAELSLNVYECDKALESKFLFKKFIALVSCREYHMALQAAMKLYAGFRDNEEFKKNLAAALSGVGAKKEAEIENLSFAGKYPKKRFILVSGLKIQPSGYLTGVAELGVALYHMGHDVSLVFAPLDETEAHYLRENRRLINRNGADMGCRQYDLEEVKRNGIDRFYRSFGNDELVVILRDPDFYREGYEHITWVFPDYSDMRDVEAAAQDISPDALQRLYDTADIVLTKDEKKAKTPKTVLWEDDGCKDEYRIYEGMWELGYEHRLSKRIIGMASALMDALQRLSRTRRV